MACCSYISVSDVRAFKTGCTAPDLTCFTDDEISDVICLVMEIIDNFTNDKWCAETLTLKFDGSGCDKLFFVPNVAYRLNDLTDIEITEGCCSGISTCLQVGDITNNGHYLQVGCYMCNGCHSICDRFPRGCKNISVTGSWGRATVPYAIKRAALLLTQYTLTPSGSSMCAGLPANVKQATWTDFQVTFDTKVTGDTSSTGFIDIDRLLIPYINVADMFMAIPDDPATSAVAIARNW